MDTIEEIKQRIDVVDLVSSYLPLKQAGRNFKANCPFHSEKSASFVVSPEKQIWHCFGCAKGGDIFKFVEEYENVDFKEALQVLANKAGVTLSKVNPELKSKKTKQFEINELTVECYHKNLTENLGKKALQYLKKRGVSESTIKQAKIGYASGSGALLKHLQQKGFNEQELKEAGVVNSKDGRFFDYFNNRVIFPFFDANGGVVGFSGRSLDEDQMPKYLNTPDTLVFNKSQALYGISLAKQAIREKGYVIVVEGQLDVLASFQAGVKNVVCSSGTALTTYHIQNLKKLTKNIIFVFDKDEAGFNASKRATETALEAGMNVKINNVKFGKDPDECIKKDKKLWTETLKEAKYAIDYYLDYLSEGKEVESLPSKKKIWSFLKPLVQRITSPAERQHWEKKIAEVTNVSVDSIKAEIGPSVESPNKFINSFHDNLAANKAVSEDRDKSNIIEVLEQKILGYLFANRKLQKHILLELEKEDFQNEELGSIFNDAQSFWANNGKDLYKFYKKLSKSEREKIDILTLGIEGEEQHTEADVQKDLELAIMRIKKNSIDKKIKAIKSEMVVADKVKNKSLLKKLQTEFHKISESRR